MQSALNIDEPDSGVLLDDMFFADGGIVPTARFIATRVEAELAFIMSKRLAGAGLHHVRRAQRDRLCRAGAGNPGHAESSVSTPRPRRRAGFLTPSPTMRPMPASCSAAGRSGRWRPTCAGSAHCVSRTASWKRPGLPPACSTIPQLRWRGLPTRSRRMGWRWSPVRSCWRARSSARSRPARATQSRPIYGAYGSVSCYFA